MADIHIGKFINNLDKEDLSSEDLQGVVNNVYARAISDHKKLKRAAEDNTKEQDKETATFVKANHDRLKANKDKIAKDINEGFERKLKPGDSIVVGGTRVVIGNILDQYYDKDYIDIEFEDENGNYRSWKSDVDGGKVIYKESVETRDVTDQIVIKRGEPGFISKMHELRDKGYECISSGNGQMVFAKPKTLKTESKEIDEAYNLPKTVKLSLVNDLELDDDNNEIYGRPITTEDDFVGDAISDYLSDCYGFTHFGFNWDFDPRDDDKVIVTDIEWDTSESKKSAKGRKLKEAKGPYENPNFDEKKFGKYFDDDNKLIPELADEYFEVAAGQEKVDSPAMSYEEAREFMRSKGLELPEYIYNMILDLNHLPHNMEGTRYSRKRDESMRKSGLKEGAAEENAMWELRDQVTDYIVDLINETGFEENLAYVVASKFKQYNPDWCSEDVDSFASRTCEQYKRTLARGEVNVLFENAPRELVESIDKARTLREEYLPKEAFLSGTATMPNGKDKYKFDALVWDEPSDKGLDGSNITYLEVFDNTRAKNLLIHFDGEHNRGWVKKAEDKSILDAVVNLLQEYRSDNPIKSAPVDEHRDAGDNTDIDHVLKEGIFGKGVEYDPADGWTPELIDLHKSIDWAARNYEEYEVPGTEVVRPAHLYGAGGEKIERIPYVLKVRPNNIFPPYYGSKEFQPFEGYTSGMADGRKYGGFDIHDRFETWQMYNMMSDSLHKKPGKKLENIFESFEFEQGDHISWDERAIYGRLLNDPQAALKANETVAIQEYDTGRQINVSAKRFFNALEKGKIKIDKSESLKEDAKPEKEFKASDTSVIDSEKAETEGGKLRAALMKSIAKDYPAVEQAGLGGEYDDHPKPLMKFSLTALRAEEPGAKRIETASQGVEMVKQKLAELGYDPKDYPQIKIEDKYSRTWGYIVRVQIPNNLKARKTEEMGRPNKGTNAYREPQKLKLLEKVSGRLLKQLQSDAEKADYFIVDGERTGELPFDWDGVLRVKYLGVDSDYFVGTLDAEWEWSEDSNNGEYVILLNRREDPQLEKRLTDAEKLEIAVRYYDHEIAEKQAQIKEWEQLKQRLEYGPEEDYDSYISYWKDRLAECQRTREQLNHPSEAKEIIRQLFDSRQLSYLRSFLDD